MAPIDPLSDVSRDRYEAAYERAVRDPRYRSALEAHLGGDDALEALAWLTNPEGPLPGTADADLGRETLMRLAYSRATEPGERVAAERKLRAIDERERRVRAKIDEAIADASRRSEPARAESVMPRPRRWRTWQLIAVGVMLLLIGTVAVGVAGSSTDALVGRFVGNAEELGYEECSPQDVTGVAGAATLYTCRAHEGDLAFLAVFATSESRDKHAERFATEYLGTGAKIIAQDQDRWIVAGTDQMDLQLLAAELVSADQP